MNNGDLVKFKEVKSKGEENLIMVIEEMRGDRCLVRSLIWESLNPTNVYMVSDLKVIEKNNLSDEIGITYRIVEGEKVEPEKSWIVTGSPSKCPSCGGILNQWFEYVQTTAGIKKYMKQTCMDRKTTGCL